MDEIVINASADLPAVTAFRNTQFIAVWADRSDGGIKGQMFGTNGSPTGTPFLINAVTKELPTRRWEAVSECGQGFAVAWIERVAGPPAGTAGIKLRLFDADTLSPGDEIQVSSAPVDPIQPPAIASLADGGFIVVWADARPDERIHAQRFAFDGTRNGAEFRVNTAPGLHRHPMATRLADGNTVIGWIARVAGQQMHVRFQILGATAAVGGEQVFSTTVSQAAMIALDSGRFVIAHVKSPGDGEIVDKAVAEAHVFEANGAASNIGFVATSETAILSSWPTLAPLPGGRLLLAWTQSSMNAPAAGTDVRARVFSETQGAVGQAAVLNTTTGGERFSLCAATAFGVGEGDNLFAAWGTQSSDGTFTRAVSGRALAVPPGGLA
jgi:hypothetical protein